MSLKPWYQYTEQEVIQHTETNIKKGLTAAEIKKRQEIYGPNRLSEGEVTSPFTILINQFTDFMVLILLTATLISGLLGEYIDAIAIIAIVILNAILGFSQEYRSERSLQALKELAAPTAMVLRDGEIVKVLAHELVPGDVVYFEAGHRIPADLRLIMAQGLYIEESALTGESVPVFKQKEPITEDNVPLGDQVNLAFMGTLVVQGKGRGIVVGTGMETEMGQIAHLLNKTETIKTPLQHRLAQLGKILISIAIVLTICVVIAGIWHGQNAYHMFLAGVSLAVAAIPEGLPAIVTIALALGVQRMIRRKAIVRKLPSVETLGCASVICSDKTGTLTENKMTVTHFHFNGAPWEVTGDGFQPYGEFLKNGQKIAVEKEESLLKALQIGLLCNNASLIQEERTTAILNRKLWKIVGDPTEGALVVLGAKAGLNKESLDNQWTREIELPFDSTRKMMSVLLKDHAGKQIVAAKGAPEVILEKAKSIMWEDKIVPLTPQLRRKIAEMNNAYAEKALRVLAIAFKDEAHCGKITEKNMEQDLVLLGLIGMIDPPRAEVKQAIKTCKQAGIKVVMITGDHILTATAIARRLGILSKGGLTVTGNDLYNMSDEELEAKIEHIHVYARVSPEHKLRIVQALQNKGHVVAMTGDGVNDAPAIKAANIGIAMGISGTDVSKEASDIILADDNFATIEAAIEEGRTIYDNIRKFIRYMLATNVGEILVMLFAMLLALPLPLIPIQILWVNLITDGLPAIALGVDPPEHNTMNRPPRDAKESIFARGLGWKIITRGFLIGLVTLAVFIISLYYLYLPLTGARTMAFATIVMAQLIHVFDCRSEKSVFHRNPFSNPYLVLAVISSVLLLIGVIHWGPAQVVFGTIDLSFDEWMVVLCFAAVPTLAVGILRVFQDYLMRLLKSPEKVVK